MWSSCDWPRPCEPARTTALLLVTVSASCRFSPGFEPALPAPAARGGRDAEAGHERNGDGRRESPGPALHAERKRGEERHGEGHTRQYAAHPAGLAVEE